jgi:hypothetical protein
VAISAGRFQRRKTHAVAAASAFARGNYYNFSSHIVLSRSAERDYSSFVPFFPRVSRLKAL